VLVLFSAVKFRVSETAIFAQKNPTTMNSAVKRVVHEKKNPSRRLPKYKGDKGKKST